MDELKNYEDGKLVTAYALFVESATKVTHLSLRNLDPVPPPSLNPGEIVKAEVKISDFNICCNLLNTNSNFPSSLYHLSVVLLSRLYQKEVTVST